jgi:hypothetical protein
MKIRIALAFTAAVLMSSMAALAQQQSGPIFPWAGQDAARPNPEKVVPPPVNFNPGDLSGVWLRGGFQALSDWLPPRMTPAGDAMFRKSIVAVPNELTQGDVPPPIKGNDPIMKCDPWGFPRVLWDFAAPMEFAHLPNRIVQFFEFTHVWRDIWMDGRDLPKDPDPRWMGYSVGRWEGETLVVETVGLDERTWLDEQGHRHSGKGRFIERYRRTGPRTLQYDAMLIDPEYYTDRWVGTNRVFQLLPMQGWPQAELREEFCAPSVETEFNETIRDPAGGAPHQRP